MAEKKEANDRSRAQRFAVSVDPMRLATLGQARGAWFETEEEIEAGLAWGREKARLLRWVRKRMATRLTRRERRCIELCFFQGLSHREAATATKTNASSVQRAIRRSIDKLRAAAREDGRRSGRFRLRRRRAIRTRTPKSRP